MPHGIRIPKAPIDVDSVSEKLKIPKVRLKKRAKSCYGKWHKNVSDST
jgi:hypothetical protein